MENYLTQEEVKQTALDFMKELGIFPPYIQEFKEKGQVTFFENFAGYYVKKDSDLQKEIEAFEKSFKTLVYAVTHELTNFGEMYSFLFVPQDCELLEDMFTKINEHDFYAYVYVWNKDYDYCSEFGTIRVQSYFGGLSRVD